MTSTHCQQKVLIVDDIASNIELLAIILQHDYHVLVATNGLDALDIASSEQPDVVLLDVVMPEMDGYEVCQYLKADERTKHIPVIFVTSNDSQEQVKRGIESGAFYYITKPINTNMLLAITRSAVEDTPYPYKMQQDTKPLFALQSLEEALFKIRTLQDALAVTHLLSALCPNPQTGYIGLEELIVNAVEHGSLGITYEEKSDFKLHNTWESEIERRQTMSEYKDKYVVIHVKRTENTLQFRITDQGTGFDWASYLTQVATYDHIQNPYKW